MPIAVQCPCGAKLKVPDASAGKRVKCPKCSTVVEVPALRGGGRAPTAASPQAPASRGPVARCPNCESEMAVDALVCVACGFNLKTGKQLKTHGRTAHAIPEAVQVKLTPLEEMMSKAEQAVTEAPLRSDDDFGSMGGNWGLTAICLCVAVLVITSAVAWFNYMEAGSIVDPKDKRSHAEKRDDVQRKIVNPTMATGLTIVTVLGAIMGIGGWLNVVRNAYQDTQLQGMLCLLGVVYYVVYSVINPRKNMTSMAISVSGFVLLGIAAGVYVVLHDQGIM